MILPLLLSCALITADKFTARLDYDGDGHIATQFDGDDCADNDASVHPDADELCNGKDDDCDGYTDEDDAVDIVSWHTDADLDGYGAAPVVAVACLSPEIGLIADGTDCDDAFAGANPGATEVCDEYDNDCDGETNEGDLSDVPWYRDDDGDRYGDNASVLYACDAPDGYTYRGDDCDDTDRDVNPGATEVCDVLDVDEDCDGRVNDDDDDVEGTSDFYLDADADGYGAGAATAYCDPPAGSVSNAADCDDTDATVTPAEGDCSIDLGSADVILEGEGSGDHAGNRVAVGDFDGDGTLDIAVAAETDSLTASNGGSVFVVDSPSAGVLSLSAARIEYRGSRTSGYLGNTIAAGDVNGDGVDDLVIGDATQDGFVYVDQSPLDADLARAESTWQARYAGGPIAICDWDSGSSDAVLVGVPYYFGPNKPGDVYLMANSTTGAAAFSVAAAAHGVGEVNGDAFGSALASGDVDGDGSIDVITGAPSESTGNFYAGAAYLALNPAPGSLDGSAADAKLFGGQVNGYAGSALAVADVDGDGGSDIIVVASGEAGGEDRAGNVYVFMTLPSGTTDLAAADAQLIGDSVYAVWTLDVGDVDGNEVADLVIGGHGYAGVRVFTGPISSGTESITAADMTVVGEGYEDQAGYSLATGDIDGDTLDDIIIGAPYNDNAGTDAGAAYIIFGSSL